MHTCFFFPDILHNHFRSSRFLSCHFISYRTTPYSYHFMSEHLISCHVISFHFMSCQITVIFMSNHVFPCHSLSFMSRHIKSGHVTSFSLSLSLRHRACLARVHPHNFEVTGGPSPRSLFDWRIPLLTSGAQQWKRSRTWSRKGTLTPCSPSHLASPMNRLA